METINKYRLSIHSFASSGTGNAVLSDAQEIHPNAMEACERAYQSLQSKRFSDTLRFSDDVIEWMPTNAEIYWVRLLAKHQCTSDAELILHGVNLGTDPNFFCAVKYAKQIELPIYKDVQLRIEKLANALEEKVIEYIGCQIDQLNLNSVKQQFRDRVTSDREKLFAEWQSLFDLEWQMMEIDMDCRIVSREHIETLKLATQRAQAIKNEAAKLTECSEQSFEEYQIKLGSILHLTEQANNALTTIRNSHPWVLKHKELTVQRDEKAKEIGSIIAGLKEYEKSIKKAIADYNACVECQKDLMGYIESKQFDKLQNFLGSVRFSEAEAVARAMQ